MPGRQPFRATRAAACCLLAAVVLALWLPGDRTGGMQHRRVRIGVDQAAPYQSWNAGAGPVGFSVDVLREAARGAHIDLQWEFHPEGPQSAFAAHAGPGSTP